jgi:hypothetical protein
MSPTLTGGRFLMPGDDKIRIRLITGGLIGEADDA